MLLTENNASNKCCCMVPRDVASCVGEDCMAWRWFDGPELADDTNRRGFCGMPPVAPIDHEAQKFNREIREKVHGIFGGKFDDALAKFAAGMEGGVTAGPAIGADGVTPPDPFAHMFGAQPPKTEEPADAAAPESTLSPVFDGGGQ